MSEQRTNNGSLTHLLSIIIPVLNEERLLPRALNSVSRLSVPVFLVDSRSSDRTVEIARQFGCQVFVGEWTSFSAKLNWAMESLPITTPWVMRVDADEYLSDLLVNELRARLPTMPDTVGALWTRRRLVFLGRWIKHGGRYPIEDLRIVRKGRARYEERLLDEQVLVMGETMRIAGDIIDEPSKGIVEWSYKHIRYAETECFMYFKLPRTRTWNSLTGIARLKRFAKEEIYGRTPLFIRPFTYWVYRYLFRLGFLDGFPGFIFHFLHAFWYRFLVDSLLYEARKTGGESVKARHVI